MTSIFITGNSKNNNYFKFRIDPVPHTGKRKYGRTWRHMKTTQERRIWYKHIEDGIHIRGRRCPRNLPTVYDDYYISYMNKWGKSSSWKRNKKRKQWS